MPDQAFKYDFAMHDKVFLSLVGGFVASFVVFTALARAFPTHSWRIVVAVVGACAALGAVIKLSPAFEQQAARFVRTHTVESTLLLSAGFGFLAWVALMSLGPLVGRACRWLFVDAWRGLRTAVRGKPGRGKARTR